MFRTRERPTRSIRDASVRIDDSREERRNAVTRLRRDIQEADSAKRRAMDDVLELAEEGLPFRDDAEIGAALDSIAADVETFMQRYNAVPVETHGDLIRLIQLPAWTVETSKDLLALIPRLRSLFRTRSCDLSRVIQTNVVPLFLAGLAYDTSPEVKLRCCWVLANVTLGGVEDCFAVVPGVRELVQIVAGLGTGTSPLVEYSLLVFGNLACEPGLCNGLISDGVAEVALRVACTIRWDGLESQAPRHALWILSRMIRFLDRCPDVSIQQFGFALRTEVIPKVKAYIRAAARQICGNRIHSANSQVVSQLQVQTLMEAFWFLSEVSKMYSFLLIFDASGDDLALITEGVIPLHVQVCSDIDERAIGPFATESRLEHAVRDILTEEGDETSNPTVLPASIALASTRILASLLAVTSRFVGPFKRELEPLPEDDLPITFPFNPTFAETLRADLSWTRERIVYECFEVWCRELMYRIVQNDAPALTLRLACEPGDFKPILAKDPARRTLTHEGVWLVVNLVAMATHLLDQRKLEINPLVRSRIDEILRSVIEFLASPCGLPVMWLCVAAAGFELRREALYCLGNTLVFASRLNEACADTLTGDKQVEAFFAECKEMCEGGLFGDLANVLHQVGPHGDPDTVMGALKIIEPVSRLVGAAACANFALSSGIREACAQLEDHPCKEIRDFTNVMGECLDAIVSDLEHGQLKHRDYFAPLCRPRGVVLSTTQHAEGEDDGIDFASLFPDGTGEE